MGQRAAVRREHLRAGIEAAILAPSLRDSRPWRFHLDADLLEVYLDPDRRLPYADATGAAARVACGAAAANAQLALAAAGVRTRPVVCPDHRQPDLLIRLEAVGSGAPTAREAALAAAITGRHDNRRRFHDRPVPAAAVAALQAAAHACGAWLDVLIGRLPLAFVSGIVDAADQALRGTPEYLDELVAGGTSSAPGSFPFGPGHGLTTEPLVAVLGTAGDTPDEQVAAGLALEHVLLTATDAGLSTSLRYQPLQVPAARDQLRRGLRRAGVPQVVARIGYAPREPSGA